MARGRMISKSLSTSERWAALHQEAPKLAEFCQSLYPLINAHADDWGCQQGDVFTIKHLVNPTSPRRLVDFDAALIALHNVGLITWYQDADEKWIVYVRGFAAHQTLKGHESRKRTFEAPPEKPSKISKAAQIRPNVPKVALTELNLTELKGTELIQTGADAPTGDIADRGKVNGEIHAFLASFCEKFLKYRGAKYSVQREKDVPLIRRLLQTYSLEELNDMATLMLTMTTDDWLNGTDRGIGILSTKANKLAAMVAGVRGTRKGVA